MTSISDNDGRLIDILDPLPEDVDFVDIARRLSRLNRYTGAGERPVSVAHHTLLGLHVCDPEDTPWWLVHDAHEARLGDTATPVKEAFAAVAAELFGPHGANVVTETRRAIELRHDRVIHEAAGLPIPNEYRRARLKQVDLVCLATERRDHLSAAHRVRGWAIDALGIEPWPISLPTLPADETAAALFGAFVLHLPVFRRAHGALPR